jgi:hypothetical protein
MRTSAVAALVVSLLVGAAVDVTACGDKFTRVGRSGRHRGYAAIHPASILIYQPVKPSAKSAKEFDALLTRAGHKAVFVPNGTALSEKLASAKFDLVIAHYADAPALTSQLRATVAGPDLVPILIKPSKATAVQAERDFHCILKADTMSTADVLEEIDHAMETRLKSKGAGTLN